MKNNRSIFGKVFALVVAVGFAFTFIPLLGFTPWQDATRRSPTELSSLSSAMTQPSRTLTVKEAYVLAQKEAQRWHGEAKLYDLISTDARDNSLASLDIPRGLGGRRANWNVFFVQPGTDKRLLVSIVNGQVAGIEELDDPIRLPFFENTNELGIDSDQAWRFVTSQLGLKPHDGWASGYHYRLRKREDSVPILSIRGADIKNAPALVALNARTGEFIARVHKVASGGGLFVSNDGGRNWTFISRAELGFVPEVIALSPNYATDRIVFAGFSKFIDEIVGKVSGSINVSKLGARGTWSTSQSDFADTKGIISLAVSPTYLEDQMVFAGTADAGIFKSTDGGVHWASVNSGLPDLHTSALVVSPQYAKDRTLYISVYDYHLSRSKSYGVFKSTDGGASWQATNSPDKVTCIALSPDYAADHTLYIGTEEKGLFKSSDGGATWNSIQAFSKLQENHVTDMTVIGNKDEGYTLFVGTRYGLFRSTDGEETWVSLTDNIAAYKGGWKIAVSPHYEDDHTLFFGTFRSGVYKSTDGGVTWELVLGSSTPKAIAISPGPQGLIVYAVMEPVFGWESY